MHWVFYLRFSFFKKFSQSRSLMISELGINYTKDRFKKDIVNPKATFNYCNHSQKTNRRLKSNCAKTKIVSKCK